MTVPRLITKLDSVSAAARVVTAGAGAPAGGVDTVSDVVPSGWHAATAARTSKTLAWGKRVLKSRSSTRRGFKRTRGRRVHLRYNRAPTLDLGHLCTGFATALRLQSSAARHRAAGNIGNIDKVRNDAAED